MKMSKGIAIAAPLLTLLTAGIATVLIFAAGPGLAAEEGDASDAYIEIFDGAAYAVAHVGSAGVGALAEKPELLGRVLILVGLAEGIAIYGLIVAILILNRIA